MSDHTRAGSVRVDRNGVIDAVGGVCTAVIPADYPNAMKTAMTWVLRMQHHSLGGRWPFELSSEYRRRKAREVIYADKETYTSPSGRHMLTRPKTR